MKNKIIISGCSYSAYAGFGTSYGDGLKRCGYDVYNIAWSGQSNESIIKKIYDCIINEDVKDCLIICQLTYTHRMGWFHSFIKRWVDYQPKHFNPIPEYNVENNNIKFEIAIDDVYMEGGTIPMPNDVTNKEYIILSKMYKTWLEYVYDETEMFNYLLYKIDTLKAYVESTGNKIQFIFWPDIQNKTQLEEIKKRNFLNVDGEYSMLKWSIKNKLIDGSTHLSKNGHIVFSNILDSKIKNTFTNIKKINKNSLL